MLRRALPTCLIGGGGNRPPSARTLYLGAGERKRASADDSALLITNVLAQRQRFLLQRISRIVSSTCVDWSGQALQACQRHGISVTWVDGRGAATGTLFPHGRRPNEMVAALDTMLEAAAGMSRYRHWLRGRRLDVLWRGRRSRIDRQSAQWASLKRQWVYQGEFEARLPREFRAHCMALVAFRLAAEQLPCVCYGPQAEPVELDEDLCELLWAEMNLSAGSCATETTPEYATIAALFERWQQCNAAALLLHIRSLERLVYKALRPEPMQ